MKIIIVFLEIVLEIIVLLPSISVQNSIDLSRFVFRECSNHSFIVETEIL